MIYLKKACLEDLEKEWLFVRDMPEDENGLTNAWHNVSREDFAEKALPEMIAFSEGKGLPEGGLWAGFGGIRGLPDGGADPQHYCIPLEKP